MSLTTERLRQKNWDEPSRARMMEDAADEIESLERILDDVKRSSPNHLPELIEFRNWIVRKLKLPPNASDSKIFGAMHVICSNAHGYENYIVSHKCDDKQGEIARQTVRIRDLEFRWTNDPPIVRGWYWYRKYPSSPEKIVHVEASDHGVLMVDGWSVQMIDGQWAGPIHEPTETTGEKT